MQNKTIRYEDLPITNNFPKIQYRRKLQFSRICIGSLIANSESDSFS